MGAVPKFEGSEPEQQRSRWHVNVAADERSRIRMHSSCRYVAFSQARAPRSALCNGSSTSDTLTDGDDHGNADAQTPE